MECLPLLFVYLLGWLWQCLIVCLWGGEWPCFSPWTDLFSRVEDLSQSSNPARSHRRQNSLLFASLQSLLIAAVWDTCFSHPSSWWPRPPTCSCSSHHRPRASAPWFDSCCWTSVLSSHAGLTSTWHLVLPAHTPAQGRISKEGLTAMMRHRAQSDKRADLFYVQLVLSVPLSVPHLVPSQPPAHSHALISWCSSTNPLQYPGCSDFCAYQLQSPGLHIVS